MSGTIGVMPTTVPSSYAVRAATAADLPAVAAIYADAVATSHATFDTVPPDPAVWQARLESEEPGDAFLVAVEGDDVLGFAYSSAYRPRPAYARTRETTVYLAAEARGRRIGTALYAELLGLLRAAGVRTAVAIVALPNDGSERLHLAAGFAKAGQLREVGHKFDRWIDVAIYQAML